MLFLVEMRVTTPGYLPKGTFEALQRREREESAKLQLQGVWKHLWRTAGAYGNVSVFDVAGPEQLHEVISGLPLFPFMSTRVTPLIAHPSAIDAASTPASQPKG